MSNMQTKRNFLEDSIVGLADLDDTAAQDYSGGSFRITRPGLRTGAVTDVNGTEGEIGLNNLSRSLQLENTGNTPGGDTFNVTFISESGRTAGAETIQSGNSSTFFTGNGRLKDGSRVIRAEIGQGQTSLGGDDIQETIDEFETNLNTLAVIGGTATIGAIAAFALKP